MPTSPIADLADQVAALLGDDWTTCPDPAWRDAVRLDCPDGRSVALIPAGSRVIARGLLPDFRHPDRPRAPEITAAAASAEFVFGHIRRRLLPRYAADLATCRRLAGEDHAERAERGQVAENIARALGAPGISDDPTAAVQVTPEDRNRRTTVRRTGTATTRATFER
ncbi:hypothetical protein ACFV3E_40805 [Streptomyces sp. NPDC059718]